MFSTSFSSLNAVLKSHDSPEIYNAGRPQDEGSGFSTPISEGAAFGSQFHTFKEALVSSSAKVPPVEEPQIPEVSCTAQPVPSNCKGGLTRLLSQFVVVAVVSTRVGSERSEQADVKARSVWAAIVAWLGRFQPS